MATLINQIYEALKNDIIQLRLKPGEKISEAKLAQKYNVSRAPIRQVIQKLQQEELVLVKPQVGTIIMPISLKRAKDILEIRLLLETYSAERAAQNVTDQDIEVLTENFRLLAKKRQSKDKKEELFRTDILLHQTIWKLGGNQEIYSIINNYLDEIRRIRLSTLELSGRLIPSEKEMKAIYLALKNRDAEAAKKAMHTHISNITKAIEYAITKPTESQYL